MDFTRQGTSYQLAEGVSLLAARSPEFQTILTTQALSFVAKLEREFGERRLSLLKRRAERQIEINLGKFPDFLPSTERIRESYWRVAQCPQDLLDRRVEITGPTDRKMIINALNSGANVYMADFEDALCPTWENLIQGQKNLSDAVDGTISVQTNGKVYRLDEKIAALMVRPRGWHLGEKHMLVDGREVSASLFDFGLFFFHNARKLVEKGTGPYFYLPKLESYFEARLWNDVFLMAQEELGIPRGTIRATVLIETILAAFEMHEILFELKEHSAGLNCGRWDYIFSVIKKFRYHPEFILPDRSRVTMLTHFLHSYSMLLIQTSHKRGTHAIGGMAAQIPIKNNPVASEQAFTKVRADKDREVNDGHDGTWVAHPGLVPLAKSVFDSAMQGPNQLHRKREDVNVTAADLLNVPRGEITEQGVRLNINVAIQYLEAWLSGNGCVPIHGLMEDTATAEISRSQLWQWILHPHTRLSTGSFMTPTMYRRLVPEELEKIKKETGDERFTSGHFGVAKELLEKLVLERQFTEFLTLVAYNHIT